MVKSDYKKYVQMFGAAMSIREFYDVFYRRAEEGKLKTPKAMEAAFDNPQTEDERATKVHIDRFNAQQATKFEQELFKQRKRHISRSIKTASKCVPASRGRATAADPAA